MYRSDVGEAVMQARRQGWRRGGVMSCLLACACICTNAHADTVSSPTANVAFAHSGAVDSGLVSLLGFYSDTRTSMAPQVSFPRFDPSMGRLTNVSVAVKTTRATFGVAPTGLLSLISFASASRALNYKVTAGTTSASDGNSVLDAGAGLITLLGLGYAEIGGASLLKTTSFSAVPDLVNFVGRGLVTVDISAVDTLTVFTVLSLFNGAGFTGAGQYAGTVQLEYTYSPYPTVGQVSIEKTASSATASRGDTITYTMAFTNNGITPVDSLAFNDMTPAYTHYAASQQLVTPPGMSATSVQTPAVGGSGPLSWTYAGQLAAGDSGSLQYSVVVD